MIPGYSLKATWYVIMLCDYITKTSPQISHIKLHTLINWGLHFKYFLYYSIVGICIMIKIIAWVSLTEHTAFN